VLGIPSLFIVDDQTTYGAGLAEQAAAAFEDLGGTVVGQESVSQDDNDFSALVTRIGDSGAEALFFPGQLASQGALMATQLLEQGVDITFFGADGFNNQQEFIDDAAGTTEGAYVSSFAPDIRVIETSADILARYVEQYDDAFSSFGPPAYVATQVVLEAMLRDYEADGELSREGTLAEVANTNIEVSLMGNPIAFDENGDVLDANFFVFVVQDGKFVFLPAEEEM
jgi:branched-chain amino acid transport system substrate-binding protein